MVLQQLRSVDVSELTDIHFLVFNSKEPLPLLFPSKKYPEPIVLCCITPFHPQLLSERVVWVQMSVLWHRIVRTLNAAAGVIGHLEFKLHLPLFHTLSKCSSKTCIRL